MPASFCYGDEENARIYAVHLTTANQSEIRKAYLRSVGEECMMNKYLNYWGLIFVIVILIPNIVFVITCKDGFENRYQNKIVEFLEQIGRFGCFFSMFLTNPFMNSGYWFKQGETVYLVFGVILVALYCLGWIVFWKEDSIRKSLYLSILPSLLFIESGIISGNILLLIFALIFAPCHILISYMNAVLI